MGRSVKSDCLVFPENMNCLWINTGPVEVRVQGKWPSFPGLCSPDLGSLWNSWTQYLLMHRKKEGGERGRRERGWRKKGEGKEKKRDTEKEERGGKKGKGWEGGNGNVNNLPRRNLFSMSLLRCHMWRFSVQSL